MISYWQQSAWFNHTDVAVIGGGIVGLSAAIHLKTEKPALRVSLFEKGVLPAGATTRNAGFACFGSISELADDLSHTSADEVYTLARKRYEGLCLLRQRLGDAAIRYEACGGYEVFASSAEHTRYADRLPEMNRALEAYTGLKDTFSVPKETPADFGFRNLAGLVFNRHEGMLHSGRMAQALMEKARGLGIQLFYGFDVLEIHSQTHGARIRFGTPAFELDCRAVLACTNGFSKPFFPTLDVKPARGLILVTAPIPGLKLRGAFHHNKGYDYFRETDGRILLGGGRNLDVEGETTTEQDINPTIYDYLRTLLHETILPGRQPAIDYIWTGTMGIGQTKAPILTEYEPNVFCAVRMGGMGVALGSQTGTDAAELVLQKF